MCESALRPSRPGVGLVNLCLTLLGGILVVSPAVAQGTRSSIERPATESGPGPDASSTDAPLGTLAPGSWLFASHPSGDSKIYRLNEFDGGADFIGEIGRNATGDIAFLPDGRLFGVRVCCGPGLTSDLLWVNPRTGMGDILGNMGARGVNALEADPDGRLFAASNIGEFLEIDVETGAATVIGTFDGDLASVGDLAFDDEGTLFASVAVSPNFNAPVPSDLAIIDPETGAATVIGPIGFDDVFGLAFHPGVVLDLSGTEIRGPTLLGLTGGGFAGTDPELIVIDRQTGAGQLLATLSTDDSMSGMAANIRWSPTRGEIETRSFSGSDPTNLCSVTPGEWTYCQHKRSAEHGLGIDGDETFAWDANLESNDDAGQPVFAVAAGEIVSLYGETPPGGGESNTVLVEHCLGVGPCDCETTPTDCWWSGYQRMESVLVTNGQQVTPSNVLGFISNVGPEGAGEDFLHFSVYEGENARDAGQGLLVSVDAVLIPVPMIFFDGFESGDTSAWSGTVP